MVCDDRIHRVNAAIFDLDDTLIYNPVFIDLDYFYDHVLDGIPIPWCMDLIESLHKSGMKIIFITARDEKCRHHTTFQLSNWFGFPYELYMRRRDDLRDDYIIKEEYLLELMERYNIVLAVDDNLRNCEMYRKYVPTLHVL